MAELLPRALAGWDEAKSRAIREISELLMHPGEKSARNWAEQLDKSNAFKRAYAEAPDDESRARLVEAYAQGGTPDLGQPGGALFVGAGSQVAGKTRGLLDARALESQGITKEYIRKSTGWHKGVDGHWRFEISDKDASLIGNNFHQLPVGQDTGVMLGHIFDHPTLYKEYPELANVKIRKIPGGTDISGSYSKATNTMEIADGMSNSQILDTIIHELQHGVQGREGWARGGSPEGPAEVIHAGQLAAGVGGWGELAKRGVQAEDMAFNVYQRLAGEVEARLAAARRLMTPEQRVALPPISGIPEGHQVVQMPNQVKIRNDPFLKVTDPDEMAERVKIAQTALDLKMPSGSQYVAAGPVAEDAVSAAKGQLAPYQHQVFDRLVAAGRDPGAALEETRRLTNLMNPPQ